MPGNHQWNIDPENIVNGTKYDEVFGGPYDETTGERTTDSVKLNGRAGADTLISGDGDDILSGGRGLDTFVFDVGDGLDIIMDYQPGIDKFDLIYATRDIEITDAYYGTLVTYGSGGFFLLGVDATEVNIYDFIF